MTLPFTDRCVLLTGAGGSIGAALAKEICKQKPRTLILLDHSERNLHQIDLDLANICRGDVRIATLGDISDETLLAELFEEHRPEIIVHTAAYKHVPLMERSPLAAVRNNVLGTNLLARMARSYGVGTFVMVSTDKAVNPHSVMGASKRASELALLRWTSPGSSMRAVRLGNVLGSHGSVVPTFLQQISEGGPVTVTHPEVSRYFHSLEEAVELLVLTVSFEGASGVYIPHPGEPVRILDLARQLIQEAGSERLAEIPIVITGLRPGDKMNEEFLGPQESVVSEQNAKVRRIYTPQPSPEQFDAAMDALRRHVERRDLTGVLAVLCQLVHEYRPSKNVLESREAPEASSR